MTTTTPYKWSQITPITDVEKSIDLAAMRPLYESWRASKSRLEDNSRGSLSEFNAQLVRRLSIETGILERLYDLDRGTTEALVKHGFSEDLVLRSSTDVEPARLIDILHDQEAAIQLVLDCIAGSRELTISIIHELQTILTRHQDSTTAIDEFGNRMEIPLLRGTFKEHPNNPKRPDGSVHEYCPPVHVESEMENLLKWLSEYSDEDPLLLASWFHHRFTQIHPYQDGNGRVARALTTLVLLRAELLPLVIDRDLRVSYIQALESADRGNLTVLVEMFASLEKNTILQALSVDLDAEVSRQESVTNAVIESLADRFNKRKVQKQAELRKVDDNARILRESAKQIVESAFARLESALLAIGKPDIHYTDGGPDQENSHWYKHEVITSAQKGGKFANFAERHYFLKASIRALRERLVFVTSFHHVGRELTGIMEATAFARLESFEDSDDRQSVEEDFFVCSIEPFVFTYRTKPEDLQHSFTKWIDAALAIAVKEYGDRL